MTAELNLTQLIGYLCTGSAAKNYQKKLGVNPVEEINEKIAKLWRSPEKVLSIKWPLIIKLWQKKQMTFSLAVELSAKFFVVQ